MKKNILILLFFLIANCKLFSQDLIRTKTDTIHAKVTEMGLDEIKYYKSNNPDGPVYVIPKSDVVEITFSNGSKFLNVPDPYDANKEVEIRNKTRCLKFEFFSPLSNDIAFGYESMIKVGTNLEFKAAVIGPGLNQNAENASGFFLKAGVKFLTTPTSYVNGAKISHGLKGGYVKPELIFNSYSVDGHGYGNYFYGYTIATPNRITYSNFAINIVFGKQIILGNIMTLDYYAGFGYGIQISNYKSNSINDSGPVDYSSYGLIYGGKKNPYVLTGGVTLGILL